MEGIYKKTTIHTELFMRKIIIKEDSYLARGHM